MRLASLRIVALVISLALWATTARAAEPPKAAELEVFPKSLELASIRDARRVIVYGKTAEGRRFDLSASAVLTPAGEQVTVDGDGYIVPKSAGETSVKIAAGGLETTLPVKVKDVTPHPVNFIQDVNPILSKVGCNAGTCHGSQKGRAGFKLSLRGYDSAFDYQALIDDLSGRRFNRSRPEQSLMLLKPTQGVPHEGGFLFDEDSNYYALIKQWIAEGCKYEPAPRVERVELLPEKPLLESEEDTQQLIVIAHYPDGSSRDVTREAVFETSNFEVATVGKTGQIQGVRRGEAAALVRYEGVFAAAPVSVLGDRAGYAWNDSPEFNFIDTHVNNKLKRIKILPADLCSDAEFYRRVSFDLVGVPPTGAQVRQFLDDPRASQEKRIAKINELLDSPGYVDHWTLKWSDLLLSNRKYIEEKGVWGFRNWIRRAVASNKPADKFAYELLTASGSTLENPAANYYRIAREPKEVMENMTQVFLGTRFNCNQCHDHPFERWTQTQYYELSAFFSGVGRKPGAVAGDEVVFDLPTPAPMVHPGTGQVLPASFPFQVEGLPEHAKNPRQELATWLVSPENPYFAKSIVNRYFSYFTGRGIVDPVDDIRASNPASNPELLDALTEDFVAHGFDVKRLIRNIVSSHTYQRSFETTEWNEDDSINYSHAVPRRLSAEQLYDAIMLATGAPERIPGMPAGFRATQLPDPNVNVSFLDMFGRAPRESPCECERSSEVSLAQTLNLVNGPTVAEAIIHPEGLLARLAKENADPKRLTEEVYLAALCRLPSADEAKRGEEYFAQIDKPSEAAEDLMWALINSPAFLFNR